MKNSHPCTGWTVNTFQISQTEVFEKEKKKHSASCRWLHVCFQNVQSRILSRPIGKVNSLYTHAISSSFDRNHAAWTLLFFLYLFLDLQFFFFFFFYFFLFFFFFYFFFTLKIYQNWLFFEMRWGGGRKQTPRPIIISQSTKPPGQGGWVARYLMLICDNLYRIDQ